jgi:hypothetical protein
MDIADRIDPRICRRRGGNGSRIGGKGRSHCRKFRSWNRGAVN